MTEQWDYEYLPFTNNQTGEEIPNFRINFTDDNKEGYVAETDENLPAGEQERFARLITAAPDMLEAAKVALRTLLTGDSKLLPINLLEEAIAKAEARAVNSRPLPQTRNGKDTL